MRQRPLLVGAVIALLVCGCGDAGTEPEYVDPDPPDPPADEPPPDPPPAADGWGTLDASPDAGDSRHDDVFFLTPELGWVISGVGNEGQIFRTEDGGESWELLHREPRVHFRAVGFATPDRGWAGNLNWHTDPDPDFALFETTDGGDTWTNITAEIQGPEPAGICGIWVVDEERAYAAGRWNGPAVFLRTDDGGETWTSTSLEPMVTGAVDVHFFDRERGLVVGGRGVGSSLEEQRSSATVILGTDDGGRTWEERFVGGPEGSWAWKISFPTEQVGYVSTQGPARPGLVLKTDDGGETWREVPVADSVGFSGIGFVTEERGWVAGPRTFETTDGGESWSEVALGERVNRFRFPGPELGFASGKRVYRLR